MRRYEDLHGYQQSAIDFIYEHDRSMALLPVGAGKTAIAWTAMAELMDAGEIDRPIVFAPMRVAQLVWAQERNQWQHLSGRPVVLWGVEPAAWADSPWKTSRQLWGSRQYLESRISKVVDVRKRREFEQKLADVVTNERKVNKTVRATVPPKASKLTTSPTCCATCRRT